MIETEIKFKCKCEGDKIGTLSFCEGELPFSEYDKIEDLECPHCMGKMKYIKFIDYDYSKEKKVLKEGLLNAIN